MDKIEPKSSADAREKMVVGALEFRFFMGSDEIRF